MTVSQMRRPEALYRYRPLPGRPRPHMDPQEADSRFKREVDAILEHSVWCSDYRAMNDPMEGYYWAEFSRNYNEAVEKFASYKMLIGLASFSETHDNELMWAHYAGNYGGICIQYQYDLLSEAFADSDWMLLQPMEYSNKLMPIADNDLVDERATIQRILLQKKQCWEYEREWRLMASLGKRLLLSGTITKIYMGERIDRDRKATLKKLVNEALPDVEFVQMKVLGYDHQWIAE